MAVLIYHASLVPRCIFRRVHKSLETTEAIHKILVDDLIFANLQFYSIETFNYMNQSHLSLKTTDLCCTISIFNLKLLELFEILRCRPTLVVHRSKYSCAVFVREKSSSVSRFQRIVEPAERTSGNEMGIRCLFTSPTNKFEINRVK
jgi:hypothetical protein